MRIKQFKKRIGMFIVSSMIIFTVGIVANAAYVVPTGMNLVSVGISGSQWKTKATGRSYNPDGYLQAAIRLGSNEGWLWGPVDTGNKQILTAYSKGRVGSVGLMQMNNDHN